MLLSSPAPVVSCCFLVVCFRCLLLWLCSCPVCRVCMRVFSTAAHLSVSSHAKVCTCVFSIAQVHLFCDCARVRMSVLVLRKNPPLGVPPNAHPMKYLWMCVATHHHCVPAVVQERVEEEEESITTLTLKDVQAALERIRPFVHETPVLTCASLEENTPFHMFFKCENLQKVRGAGFFFVPRPTPFLASVFSSLCPLFFVDLSTPPFFFLCFFFVVSPSPLHASV